MEEHENKDIEPDPAGAEAGARRHRQQRGLVADAAWGVMEWVVVAVLLVVVVEIGMVELLVVGFGGLRLLELLLLRFTGDPLHVTAFGFRALWRSVQQPCQWIRKLWWVLSGLKAMPFLERFSKLGLLWWPCPRIFLFLPLTTFPFHPHLSQGL